MITCISVLEHIKDYNNAMNSMSKLINPGGFLILSFPYNEKKYVENVYFLPDSCAPKNLPFTTQAFSRLQINQWSEKYILEIIEQEYWKFYTGDYWTTGEKLHIPIKTNSIEKHQISCIIFKKI